MSYLWSLCYVVWNSDMSYLGYLGLVVWSSFLSGCSGFRLFGAHFNLGALDFGCLELILSGCFDF